MSSGEDGTKLVPIMKWDFPGGIVAKTLAMQGAPEFSPWSRELGPTYLT